MPTAVVKIAQAISRWQAGFYAVAVSIVFIGDGLSIQALFYQTACGIITKIKLLFTARNLHQLTVYINVIARKLTLCSLLTMNFGHLSHHRHIE